MTLAVLRQAMEPTSVSDATLTAYLPHFNEAMRAAQVTTVRRGAAWYSQLGHESAGLKYMAEIQTNGPGWSDDRRIYRGRGPIQLTWQGNYRKFGQWCQQQGYVDDPELFVKQPTLVEQPRWGFLAASWYWLNGGPRPGQINSFADAGDILAVSRCVNGWVEGKQPNGIADRTARWDRCLAIGAALLDSTLEVIMPDNRPDFNEYPMWSSNNSGRGGTKVDLFLLHTQEGDGNADSLARWMEGHEVSYHYTISEDPKDHGVTVVDVVDTDSASWSVLSANPRSINLCFAGSRAAWSRTDWLKQSRAIDVAAYLAVQDCKKYSIAIKVLAPPYNSNPPGISDHKYVTEWLKDGTHTDVGPNFPWDVFAAAVAKYASDAPAPPVVPPPPAPAAPPDYLKEVWEQLRGPGGNGWKQLGGRSLVDAVAELLKDKP